MVKTIQAIVKEDGKVELLEPLTLEKERRAVVTLLDDDSPEDAVVQALRPIGLAQGLFEMPNGFDDPLPDDILDDFSAH